jgi:hypothetical protein
MSPLLRSIVEKLQTMPEPTLEEVLDFVDFLRQRRANQEKSLKTEESTEPLLAIAGILSSIPPSTQAIEAELYGSVEQE